MTALVLEWRAVDAVRVAWTPQPVDEGIPAAIIGPPGSNGLGGGVSAVTATAPVTSSGGSTPVIGILAATPSAAGSLSAADKAKLDGVAAGATANDSNANLKARANHTGTQSVATITGNWPVGQLNGGVGASATTFWRGDGSWAVPSGGTDPASFAASPSSAGAGSVGVGERTLANREFLTAAGSLWPEEQMQGRFDRMGRASWRAGGGGVLVAAEGATTLTTVGTATTRGQAATSLVTRAKRQGYVSAASLGALAGTYLTLAHYTVGDGAGLGGFYFTCRFVPSDAAAVSGARMFAGLTSSVGAPANVEPSALTNAIGVAALSTSPNLSIVSGGSAAQAPVDLGSDFPANGLSADIYELILFAPPGSQSVHWRVTRNPGGPGNGFVASGTLANPTPGTTLPAASTFLAPRLWRCNNATALAVGIDLLWMAVETVN